MDQLRLLGPEAFAVLDRAPVELLVLACHDPPRPLCPMRRKPSERHVLESVSNSSIDHVLRPAPVHCALQVIAWLEHRRHDRPAPRVVTIALQMTRFQIARQTLPDLLREPASAC